MSWHNNAEDIIRKSAAGRAGNWSTQFWRDERLTLDDMIEDLAHEVVKLKELVNAMLEREMNKTLVDAVSTKIVETKEQEEFKKRLDDAKKT